MADVLDRRSVGCTYPNALRRSKNAAESDRLVNASRASPGGSDHGYRYFGAYRLLLARPVMVCLFAADTTPLDVLTNCALRVYPQYLASVAPATVLHWLVRLLKRFHFVRGIAPPPLPIFSMRNIVLNFAILFLFLDHFVDCALLLIVGRYGDRMRRRKLFAAI